MKLIHISDIHLNPARILDDDPIEQFKKVVAYIETYLMDADKIVITGDLTHIGMLESYEVLRDILAASKLKGDLEPVLMIGNHDERVNFATVFPDQPKDDQAGQKIAQNNVNIAPAFGLCGQPGAGKGRRQ